LPGTYAVTLIVSTGGCGDTIVDSVKVYPIPIPAFVGTNVCQGDTTLFTNSSTIAGGTITSWIWSFGDLSTSNIQTPTHLYKTSGTYTVSLTVTSNNGCDSTFKSTVVVNPLPIAAFSATTPCAGTATQFTDGSTVSSGSISSWSWYFGDGGTSILQNPSHLYSTAGTYPVTLKITSNNGCIDSITKNVTVNPNPVPGFYSDTAGCATLCVKFMDTSKVAAPAVISNWLWNFGDGTTDSNTLSAPGHCYTKPGTYSVSLTVSTKNGCTETFTRPNYITAWPLPVANFNASPNPTVLINDPTVYFINTSTGNPVGWTWETFGDGSDSVKLTENTTHTYQDTGTFYTTLIVVNKYGCVDSVKEPIVVQPVWTFYVPNAFTPNGDGINDYFIGKGIGLLNYEMWIFDRWGMQLYHCTDINKPWDGKVQNSSVECQEDTYVYLIVITDVFHNQHRYVGKVSIIK
jgi:gliding motility-associated-like protein